MGAGGVIIPPRSYFEKIQEVLRHHDVLFVADEVICGFGRTGNWWGSQTFGLKPDMVTCAKALSAAYQPISALMINEKIHQAMLAESDKLGGFAHGYTYSGHPVTAAVALEVMKIYEEMDITAQTRRLGKRMVDGLRRFAMHPLVGEVGGVGMIAGVELVRDKPTRASYEPAGTAGNVIDRVGRDNGLILRVIGDRVGFAPPFIMSEAEIDDMVARFGRTLDEAHRELAG
jgi:4-aminobutyrate--pyruvate transaminase